MYEDRELRKAWAPQRGLNASAQCFCRPTDAAAAASGNWRNELIAELERQHPRVATLPFWNLAQPAWHMHLAQLALTCEHRVSTTRARWGSSRAHAHAHVRVLFTCHPQ